jgi:hypothetical protein
VGSWLKQTPVLVLLRTGEADFSTAPFDFAQGPVEMTDLFDNGNDGFGQQLKTADLLNK